VQGERNSNTGTAIKSFQSLWRERDQGKHTSPQANVRKLALSTAGARAGPEQDWGVSQSTLGLLIFPSLEREPGQGKFTGKCDDCGIKSFQSLWREGDRCQETISAGCLATPSGFQSPGHEGDQGKTRTQLRRMKFWTRNPEAFNRSCAKETGARLDTARAAL
jgi:hypothetical protein